MEEKRRSRAKGAAYALLGAALLAGAYVLHRSGLLKTISSVEDVRALMERAGPFAGAAYFFIQLLTVVFAPIPSNVSMLAGALALGFWPALLLGVAAIFCGSMLVFWAARRLGQKAVQRFADRGVMEKYLPVIREKQEVFLFFALLLPFFPDDMLCILAGLTTMPAARFAAIMLLARPWGLVFAALLGGGVIHLPLWGWVLMLAALAVVFALAMKHSAKIENKLLALIARFGKGKRT